MSEEREQINLVELFDEDGNKEIFEHLDTLEFEGNSYVVCIPYDEEVPENIECEVVILLIKTDDEGEEFLEQIVDDDLLDNIYEAFKSRNSEFFDFED